MVDQKRLEYQYRKTVELRDKFLAAFRAIMEYEEKVCPGKDHLDKLHYHLLTAVNMTDALLKKQSEELDAVGEVGYVSAN